MGSTRSRTRCGKTFTPRNAWPRSWPAVSGWTLPAGRSLAKDSAIAGHFAADAQAALLAEGRRIVETRAAALIEVEAEEEALDGDE